MSEGAVKGAPPGTEGGTSPEEIELPRGGALAFGALMDALSPDTDEASAGEGQAAEGADEGAAAAGTGAAAPGATGDGAPADGAAGATPGTPAAGAEAAGAGDAGAAGADAGSAAVDAAVGGGVGRPESWTADAAELIPRIGELATKVEERTSLAYQTQAFEAVKNEYGQYFDALNKHPRLLVGTEVPALGREGKETLQSTEDAREWQEAVKSLLEADVRERATKELDANRGFLDTVHASIQMFQDNPDLVPGSKQFDVDLANRFTDLVQPYELRVDGKLQGYSVPVQPLIERVRTQLEAERAKAPAAPATPGAGKTPAKPAAPPQAGITSKAGAGTNSEDYGSLFGTIGLPDFRI